MQKVPDFKTAASFLNFSLPGVMWIVLAVAVVICAIITAILIYHWRMYGMHNRRIMLAELVYIIVSIIIIIVAAVSITLV